MILAIDPGNEKSAYVVLETDLYVLNEDFIMDAIREKMEREAKKEE